MGADINETGLAKYNALIFISKKMYKFIKNKNEKKEVEDLRNYYIEAVKLLVKKGININHKGQCEITCLYYFFINNDVEIIKELIKNGINIYEKDGYNGTPLMNISEKIKSCKDKFIKDEYIKIAYMIIRKMADDYIHLFISLNKNFNAPQKSKDVVNNQINMLYSLQKLPVELFIEIIKQF